MAEEKTVLTLDKYETGIILRILNDRRTQMIQEDKDPEIVNEIMKKVLKAPSKKHGLFYRRAKHKEYER